MKVLCVDDNPMTGIILSDTLSDLGHTPFVAKDPNDAFMIFEREAPEVCILDWMMPGTNGLELACALRKHRNGSGTYVIMLSSRSDVESVALAYELGVDEFLCKPVASGELKARLHTASNLVELRRQYADKCREIAGLYAELDRLKAVAEAA